MSTIGPMMAGHREAAVTGDRILAREGDVSSRVRFPADKCAGRER